MVAFGVARAFGEKLAAGVEQLRRGRRRRRGDDGAGVASGCEAAVRRAAWAEAAYGGAGAVDDFAAVRRFDVVSDALRPPRPDHMAAAGTGMEPLRFSRRGNDGGAVAAGRRHAAGGSVVSSGRRRFGARVAGSRRAAAAHAAECQRTAGPAGTDRRGADGLRALALRLRHAVVRGRSLSGAGVEGVQHADRRRRFSVGLRHERAAGAAFAVAAGSAARSARTQFFAAAGRRALVAAARPVRLAAGSGGVGIRRDRTGGLRPDSRRQRHENVGRRFHADDCSPAQPVELQRQRIRSQSDLFRRSGAGRRRAGRGAGAPARTFAHGAAPRRAHADRATLPCAGNVLRRGLSAGVVVAAVGGPGRLPDRHELSVPPAFAVDVVGAGGTGSNQSRAGAGRARPRRRPGTCAAQHAAAATASTLSAPP